MRRRVGAAQSVLGAAPAQSACGGGAVGAARSNRAAGRLALSSIYSPICRSRLALPARAPPSRLCCRAGLAALPAADSLWARQAEMAAVCTTDGGTRRRRAIERE